MDADATRAAVLDKVEMAARGAGHVPLELAKYQISPDG
jgi:hypothetical protein